MLHLTFERLVFEDNTPVIHGFMVIPCIFLLAFRASFSGHSRLDRESNFEEMPGLAGHDGGVGCDGNVGAGHDGGVGMKGFWM